MQGNSCLGTERKLRVCFLVRQLNMGGAQRQLIELVRSLDQRRFAAEIVTLYDGGEYWVDAAAVPGVRCASLGKRGRWDLGAVLRFACEMRRSRPDVVQGCLGVCNLLALCVRAIAPSTRVVWSIRCSEPDFASGRWLSRLSFGIERIMSRLPDRIIANSQAGRDFHVRRGYPSGKIAVIRNGIDSKRFRPDAEARKRMRGEWKVAPEERVVMIAGRIHPQKGHSLFLRAAALAAKRRPGLRFAVVGDGSAQFVTPAKRLASSLGIDDRVIWAGAVLDMVAAYNAADIVTSCSSSEGFANALCEAMACGIPCAATAVGDSRFIVGAAGVLIESMTPESVAKAWLELLARCDGERDALAIQARRRIESECARDELARKTAQVFEEIL
jgi:glycosyltransferase involved in cell wall biosynthesis